MKKKKKIILSYDYELFFGERSGTVLKSIIEPTNKLMEVMEQNGFRGNFFVDYLMFRELETLSDARAVSDLNLLKEQIRDLVRRGHRVELHLHPHWIDAQYNGDGTWDFSDFTHYSLSSLDEGTIVEMFVNGTNYLTALAREVEPDYEIVAFRAGGWAVQPFDKLKKGFLAAGIKIDSSTSYGIYKYMKDSYYDFREMPNKTCYQFENNVCKEMEQGAFREVPITSFHRNLLGVLVDRYYGGKLHYFDKISDGTHNRTGKGESVERLSFMYRLKSSYKLMFSFSMQSPLTVKRALCSQKKDLYCYIDHPKDYSKATEKGINVLGGICESINYIDLL